MLLRLHWAHMAVFRPQPLASTPPPLPLMANKKAPPSKRMQIPKEFA